MATLLFIDFLKAFGSIHIRKMKQILLAFGHLKESVTTIMMVYKNTKAMFRFPDGDTNFFDIVIGILRGDLIVLSVLVICRDYKLNKTKGFYMEKKAYKQLILYKNTDKRRWSNASWKYTCLSRIRDAQPSGSRKRHWLLCESE